jgi:hypothetical protein
MPDTVKVQKPVCVALHAQEIGRLYADRVTPFEYMQGLLYRLREAGAPVEGTNILRLAHGKVFKLRQSNLGRAWVSYLWLPEEKVAELEQWRKENGLKGLEGMVQ